MQEVDPVCLAAQDDSGGQAARQILQTICLEVGQLIERRLRVRAQRALAQREASMSPKFPGGQFRRSGFDRVPGKILNDQQRPVAVQDERSR